MSASPPTTRRAAGDRTIVWAAGIVATLWLIVAFASLALDIALDGEAFALLALASLAAFGLASAGAGLASAKARLVAPAHEALPVTTPTARPPRPRRPPRIVVTTPCCHCGRTPVRPRREPRIIRRSRSAHHALPLDRRYRRPRRIISRH